jgi:hypothetical protein
MELQAKVKVTSKGNGFCKVQNDNGTILTLQLSEKVRKFYKHGLEENNYYLISYDDESNILLYAKEEEKKIKKNYDPSGQITGMLFKLAIDVLLEKRIFLTKENIKKEMGTLTSIYEEIQEEYKGRWNQ